MPFSANGHGDGQVVHIHSLAGKLTILAPKTFFHPHSTRRYSLVGRIKPETAIQREAFIQEQPKGISRTKALETEQPGSCTDDSFVKTENGPVTTSFWREPSPL